MLPMAVSFGWLFQTVGLDIRGEAKGFDVDFWVFSCYLGNITDKSGLNREKTGGSQVE